MVAVDAGRWYKHRKRCSVSCAIRASKCLRAEERREILVVVLPMSQTRFSMFIAHLNELRSDFPHVMNGVLRYYGSAQSV
jgi:hypothetical protein